MKSRVLLPWLALALLGAAAGGCVSKKAGAVTSSGALRILSIAAEPETVYIDEQSVLSAAIDNPSGSPLAYAWTAYRGSVFGQGSTARYFGSYCCAGTDYVVLDVRNERGERDQKIKVLAVYQTTR